MLSKKQLKRKSMIRSALRLTTKLIRSNSQDTTPMIGDSNYDGLNKSSIDTARSDSTTTLCTSEASNSDKSDRSSWVTLESPKTPFFSNTETMKLKNIRKKVKFCKMVKVILIPTRREFAIVASDIWWNVGECEIFKKEAYYEMKAFIEKHRCTVKDGIFALYQPHEDYSLASLSTPPLPTILLPSSNGSTTLDHSSTESTAQPPTPLAFSSSNTLCPTPVLHTTTTQISIPSSHMPKFQLIRSSTNGPSIKIPSRLFSSHNYNNSETTEAKDSDISIATDTYCIDDGADIFCDSNGIFGASSSSSSLQLHQPIIAITATGLNDGTAMMPSLFPDFSTAIEGSLSMDGNATTAPDSTMVHLNTLRSAVVNEYEYDDEDVNVDTAELAGMGISSTAAMRADNDDDDSDISSSWSCIRNEFDQTPILVTSPPPPSSSSSSLSLSNK